MEGPRLTRDRAAAEEVLPLLEAERRVGERSADALARLTEHDLRSSEVRAGDTLRLQTGEVAIEAVYASHGGVELVVRPVRGTTPRSLWFWSSDAVSVVARSSETGGPGAALAPRAARGAAGRRCAAVGGGGGT